MNEAALKYKIYKVLLESNTSQKQRDLMVELGLVDSIMSFFKGAGKGAKKMMSAIGDEISQEKIGAAQKNIAAAIEDLKDIAKKAGKDDAFVNALLQQLLQSSGVDSQAIASASPEEAVRGSEQSAAASGAPITVQTLTQSPQQQIAFVSAVTGKPTDQVATQIQKQKPDGTALINLAIRAASKATGVKDDVMKKIFKALIDAGELKEGRRRHAKLINESTFPFERWQQLAGVTSRRNKKLLFEAELERDAKSVLPKLQAVVDKDPKNKEMFDKLLDDIKNDKKPDERSYKVLRNILTQNKEVKDDARVFFSDVEDTLKSTLEKGLTSAKGKADELSKELDVSKEEIKKHQAEAEKLAKELEQSKASKESFRAELAKAFGLDPDEFKEKFGQEGFAPLIAAAMAKKPNAVEKAAEKADVDVSNLASPEKKNDEGKAGESRIGKVIRDKIKPDELSDDDLGKVVPYIEDLLDKVAEAKKAAAEESK